MINFRKKQITSVLFGLGCALTAVSAVAEIDLSGGCRSFNADHIRVTMVIAFPTFV